MEQDKKIIEAFVTGILIHNMTREHKEAINTLITNLGCLSGVRTPKTGGGERFHAVFLTSLTGNRQTVGKETEDYTKGKDDSLPSGPPPQIRILKRPTTNGVLSNPNSASRPAFPVKSLAQREAEYAEARKRILGSASPEEEQEKPILDRPTRISQPEDSRQPNNVIRQPLGPDGSQGFKQRR
ncbi:hypothetical protein KIL84_022364 [Mauremys mutica]|uniref:SUZ RNA-binding domain-containing n=1 Tax=Mauremys mutica TaxID=74926 RepID=A0A9D3X5Q8_9SAUR|nr:hypothetical protein KIL84_022364 [Mauremys mutica]